MRGDPGSRPAGRTAAPFATAPAARSRHDRAGARARIDEVACNVRVERSATSVRPPRNRTLFAGGVDLWAAVAEATAGDHSRCRSDRVSGDGDLPPTRRKRDAAARARA